MKTRPTLTLTVTAMLFGLLSFSNVHAEISTNSITQSDEETVRAAKKKKKTNAGNKQNRSAINTAKKIRKVLPRINLRELEATPAYQSAAMRVNEIKLEGNTVFSQDEIQQWLTPLQKREVNSDELRLLADNITQHYIDRGYLNSGVYIPDQEISNGIVILKAVEGKLNAIEISGNDNVRNSYIENRIRADLSSPLNVTQLKQSLQLFERDPHIQQINAQLLPSAIRGESILHIKLRENKPYTFGFNTNNYRSPAIGEEQMRISAAYRNLSGKGDKLSTEFGLTQGNNEVLINYSIPLNARNMTLDLQHARTSGSITLDVTGNDDPVIRSDAIQSAVGISYPFIRRLNHSLDAILRFESKQSQSFINDFPISLITGEQEDGKAQVSVLSAGVSWNRNFGKKIIAIYTATRVGLNVLDATVNDNSADGRFIAFHGQTHYLHYLGAKLGQINVRANWQISPSPLLALEKMAVGGASSVRGYQENQLLGDNAVNTSIEWRIPLQRVQYKSYFRNTQIFPFIDQAYAHDGDPFQSGIRSKTLLSTGLGIRSELIKNLKTEISWAKIYNPFNEHNAPYEGVLLSLGYSY